MGLRFSHGSAAWSHQGFHEFRRRLAFEIGMDLDSMAGFDTPGLSWANVIDPIAPLLNHADNEGHLLPVVCISVARRLRILISDWPDDDYDKIAGMKLANGMEEAAGVNEPLGFL